MKRILLSAAAASLAMLGAAQITPVLAQTMATATSDVNIRSGPGPDSPVIGNIKSGRRANVIGCVEGSLWCQIEYRGRQGWAYSQYMTLDSGARRAVVAEPAPSAVIAAPRPVIGQAVVPVERVVTYQAPTYAAPVYTTPTTSGSVTTGVATVEDDDVISSDARGAFAAAPGVAITPPATVGTYVTTNRLDPIVMNTDVVVGATLPRTADLQPVPDYRYQYVYVNDYPVLVDPATRRVVYVFR